MSLLSSLTIDELISEAREFARSESKISHNSLYGVTDGKAIGTYVETRFSDYLTRKGFTFQLGNHSKGLDFGDGHINTDIKVTSIRQPQSSCPFKSYKEKVYGLGYNLLIFVYDKTDVLGNTRINFVNCVFIDQERTADYQTTKGITQIIQNDGNVDDLIAYFYDRNLPADPIAYLELAEEILQNPPKQGYLTISNALQWRVQYQRAITLGNEVNGIINIA